ncbi:MAG: DUF4062 domain-containing protein [Dehalococcoidia bacterium]
MKVFVSSTYDDLKSHRAVVEASLVKSGYEFNGMEHFTAEPRPPLATCLEAVRRSDVFVGILGTKYGSCPPGSKLSYSEREYLLAHALRKPVFVFLIDEQGARIAPQYFETNPKNIMRLEKLKRMVLKRHNIARFTSEDNLAWQILASLRIAEMRAKEAGLP